MITLHRKNKNIRGSSSQQGDDSLPEIPSAVPVSGQNPSPDTAAETVSITNIRTNGLWSIMDYVSNKFIKGKKNTNTEEVH